MTESKVAALAYPRLCIAYFLQFAIWGSWAGFALSAYAGGTLKLPGLQIGWLFAAIPLGAIISPLFIAPIADRYFSAQKVVSLLHLLGGLALAAAGLICQQSSLQGDTFFYVLFGLILFSGICYMPTIALVNSIVFKHSPSGSAPYVFVFGTFGWIVINLVIAALPLTQPYFFYVAAGCAVLLALYSLSLPDTPPKGAPAAGEKSDALGLGAVKLLFTDAGFAFFVFVVFLGSIPACGFFFAFQGAYMAQHGYPTALVTLNQFSELFFMSLLPFFIARIGLKWVVVLGLGAWALRYWVFALGGFEQSVDTAAVIALLLHGFCYSFLYVAAYMYADAKAPANLKNSVQGLMAFLLLGVGQTLGSLGYGYIRDLPDNAPAEAGIKKLQMLTENEVKTYSEQFVLPSDTPADFWKKVQTHAVLELPAWSDSKAESSWVKYLDLGKLVQNALKKEDGNKEETKIADLSFLDADKDNKLTSKELDALKDKTEIGGVKYEKAELLAALKKIVNADKDEFEIERAAYLKAQSYNWFGILVDSKNWNGIPLGPATFTALFFLLFLLFGRGIKEETKPEAKG
ncbi:MAG: MFS transporter [Planctomycetaceae bacterium]|jgi:nucleoside transporter|nr:MFS transporter [Planctomycetaceae bacterium]